MKDEIKYNLWSVFLEEYKEYLKSDDENWYDKFEEVKIFMNENNKRPNKRSENTNEKILGGWISNQQKNYKTNKQAMKDEIKYNLWSVFLEEYKEYLKSDDENWYDKFEEVKIFMNENNKRPNKRSENTNEKILGGWISNQQKNYKTNKQSMKDEIKYNLWSVFLEEYKEYLKSDDENWYDKFEEVKIFMNENNKRPNKRSENTNEKILGGWISNQQKNYKTNKQAMKDEIKYNLWTEFKKKYLDNDENVSTTSTIIIEDEEEEFIMIAKPIVKVKKSMKLSKQNKPKGEYKEEKRENVKSEISILHKKYKTLHSKNLNKEFNENPELWKKYHEISEENEKSFPENEIPRNRIIKELDKICINRCKKIVDMGCGKADISKYFKNDPRYEFINFDHIAYDEYVISRDISNTELQYSSIEICILCLAMWGSNCRDDYIKETQRILESGGILYIIEPTKRWSEKDEFKNIIPGQEGMILKLLLEKNGFEIIKSSIEKFCLFICINNKVYIKPT